MAAKNASLGALDALRTKVRDKTDTNDKKKVKAPAQPSKKNKEKKADVISQKDDLTAKSVDKNNSVRHESADTVEAGNGSDNKDSLHEATTTTVDATATAASADISGKKKAGRKRIADNKKRVQITLTISHSANDRLTEWASDMPKSGSRLLSDYIDYHLEDIIDYYNKIL